ncbi:NADH dehydrogenase (ubiquinone) MLRQ subunit [Lycorma delicatula]|uniref:NADH dehydrogenase (ubiquinone) MLRQ subunit n=1 Tax=Lycorma delicatula TaxID=130591 RepID=UPI003F5135A1
MKGLTWSSLKKEPALIPLYVIVGAGCLGAVFYSLRLALKSPDVAWTRKENQPYDEYANKQYKFLSPTLDYSKLESKAPKF